MFKTLLRLFLFIFGFLLAQNSYKMLSSVSISFGNLLPIGLGIFMIVISLFLELILKNTAEGFPKILRIGFFSVCIILVVGFFIFWNVSKNKLEGSTKEPVDAIIILGAALVNNKPSSALSMRLYTGYEYLKSNPETIVIVSGGKGKGKIVSESSVMKKYLLDKGIEENRIIEEDKSTSTKENFLYSKEILDNRFKSDYSIAFVTNDFHVLRSGFYAKDAGFNDSGSIYFNSPKNMIPNYYIREYLAVLWYLVFE